MKIPEPEDHDPIVALMHLGKNIVMHLTIHYNPETKRYDIKLFDEEVIESTDTQALAIRLADLFMHGYMNGYEQGRDDDLGPRTDDDIQPHIHAMRPPISNTGHRPEDRRN